MSECGCGGAEGYVGTCASLRRRASTTTTTAALAHSTPLYVKVKEMEEQLAANEVERHAKSVIN